MNTTTFKAKCLNCGAEVFSMPPNPTPDDQITCGGCSEVTRYADVLAAQKKFADDLLQDALRDGFGGWKTTKE